MEEKSYRREQQFISFYKIIKILPNRGRAKDIFRLSEHHGEVKKGEQHMSGSSGQFEK